MQPLLQAPQFEDSEAKYDTWILDLFQFETATPKVQDIASVIKDRLETECANPAVLKKGGWKHAWYLSTGRSYARRAC